MINTNVIDAARKAGVRKITVMGTVAAYPHSPSAVPLKEDAIFSGLPHHSEDSYAHAKRAMLAMLRAYRESYGLDWAYMVSCNLYGPNDKFDTRFGHVVPSLIKKFFDAAQNGGTVLVWGDGSPRRDFMYVKDLARAALTVMQSIEGAVNVGAGKPYRIKELVEMLADISGLAGRVVWDLDKPNGQRFKACDFSRLNSTVLNALILCARGCGKLGTGMQHGPLGSRFDEQKIKTPFLLISQWPDLKNAEYEMIERIRQTDYDITVVDYLGFDVDSGRCLNTATLHRDFDFALSLHYDTPKLLNIRTFYWISNPVPFMHLRHEYLSHIFHNKRAFDGYILNCSDYLTAHIRNLLGSEWPGAVYEMHQACARSAIKPPRPPEELPPETARKIFYCGVNWERCLGRVNRANGLLEILQARDLADFYGPEKFFEFHPWEDFTSYKGEIPFDGVSMLKVMSEYRAVLAISSPAHLRSRSSSGRVYEGTAAGVPVISDHNHHVHKLFGDLVYYFEGDTEPEKAASITSALERIINDPQEARARVEKAQELMLDRFCYENTFEAMARSHYSFPPGIETGKMKGQVEIFLLHHDPDPQSPGAGPEFHNLEHILECAAHGAELLGVRVRINRTGGNRPALPAQLPEGVSWRDLPVESLDGQAWDDLRLGEKVAGLARQTQGDWNLFFTQFDFPQYDYLEKALAWFEKQCPSGEAGLFVAGFYQNDFSQKAPYASVEIMRNNRPASMYRWTMHSLHEHQMGALCLNQAALTLLDYDKTCSFDSVLPISLILGASASGMNLHRSRHILLRVQFGAFARHVEAHKRAAEGGFWALQYELNTNYNHELNALCDVHHESEAAVQIAGLISGQFAPPAPPPEPSVVALTKIYTRLAPAYRALKAVVMVLRFKKKT